MSEMNHCCYQCVSCGHPLDAVSSVVVYSLTSMALAKCPVCSQPLDRFVEFQLLLVALELALHRIPAFRHLQSNRNVGAKNWFRFTCIHLLVEALSLFWRTGKEPNTLYGTLMIIFHLGLSFMLSSACFAAMAVVLMENSLPPPSREAILRALVVSKFPNVLYIIAIAWGYNPLDFFWLVSLYSFTATVAAARALPGIDTLSKAILIAMAGFVPKLWLEAA